MQCKSADSKREVFVSNDLDNKSVAHSQNVGGSPNTDILKKCPVCNAAVRYFALNLDEKILLCENVDCSYPLGYTKLQFVKEEELCPTANKKDSTTNVGDGQAGSIKSTDGWFLTCNLESTLQKTNESNSQDNNVNPELNERQADLQVKASVQQIRKLQNKIQKRHQKSQVSYIMKKEFIHHLKNLQGPKGKLVKKLEISRITPEKEVPPVDTSGITIEIVQPKKKRTYKRKPVNRPGVARTEWIPCNSLYGGPL